MMFRFVLALKVLEIPARDEEVDIRGPDSCSVTLIYAKQSPVPARTTYQENFEKFSEIAIARSDSGYRYAKAIVTLGFLIALLVGGSAIACAQTPGEEKNNPTP